MRIEALRKLAGREVIDYNFLISALGGYAHPRDKISVWLKRGELIRIKKGLYVFGKSAALVSYSLEIVANLIYGPSAISLSYALSYYGLIPERVDLVTSITNKRRKQFETPVGHFVYYYLSPEKYAEGLQLNTMNEEQFLIATPEKALCDQLYLIDRDVRLKKSNDMADYLFHDMRLDEAGFQNLSLKQLEAINQVYKQKSIALLIQLRKQWK